MGNHKIVVDGVTKDLQDDYNVTVESESGSGIPPINNLNTEMALQPGALIQGQSYNGRAFTWNCHIKGTTQPDFHDKRRAFIKALDTQTGKINERPTPIEFHYTGATVSKKINAVYDGGLEGNNWNQAFQEKFSLRLRADDPFWKSQSDTTTALDSNDSATFTVVGKRESDGSSPIWNELGPPNASGTYTDVKAIISDDTYIYFGGTFTNFDNIAAADYIVRMNKSTEVYTAMGTGMNGRVDALAIGPDGTLYAGGDFTLAGGVASTVYIAAWNGTAWSALGTGMNSLVRSLAIGSDGTLYAGGGFTLAGGVASTAYIAAWNGTAWSALSTGMNSDVWALTAVSGTLYAGGDFTTAGGASIVRIASWNGTAWSALSTGMDTSVYSLTTSANGTLYAGGSFSTAGTVTAGNVASWNGTAWSALGTGMSDIVYAVITGPGDIIYASGTFEMAGGRDVDRLAVWNGSTWAYPDISLPGSPTVYGMHFDTDNNFYIGFDTDGTGNFSGDTTIAYAGTAKSQPQITINRDAGTSAKLISLRNETTGAILYFDYDLLDGETLTLEFDQRAGAFMTSSFKGNVYSSLLPNSDFGQFYLTNGNASGTNDNVITLFVDNDGATITSNIIYTTNYVSAD